MPIFFKLMIRKIFNPKDKGGLTKENYIDIGMSYVKAILEALDHEKEIQYLNQSCNMTSTKKTQWSKSQELIIQLKSFDSCKTTFSKNYYNLVNSTTNGHDNFDIYFGGMNSDEFIETLLCTCNRTFGEDLTNLLKLDDSFNELIKILPLMCVFLQELFDVDFKNPIESNTHQMQNSFLIIKKTYLQTCGMM